MTRWALLCLVCLFPATAHASEPARDGMFLTVPNPIDDAAINQMEAQIRDATLRQGRTLGVIVFDFNPQGQASGTSNFHACARLQDMIAKLQNGAFDKKIAPLRTVAFVHQEVTKHTLLPVLVCKELVMGTSGKLGEVLAEGVEPLNDLANLAYAKAAEQYAPSQDLVHKLLDRNMSVVRVAGKDGIQYVDQRRYDELRDKGQAPGLATPMPELAAGRTIIDGDLARQVGLCKRVINTRPQLAQAYGLPPQSLHEDALAGRTPVVWRIEVRSPFNKARLDSLERRVRYAVARGANFIFLQLDCDGGDTVDVLSTARFLRTLKDDSNVLPVKTVAYIPKGRHLGAATYLALACSQIVMAEDAVLGDFDYLQERKDLEAPRELLVKLAHEQGLADSELLFQATLEPGMELYRARNKTEPGRYRVVQAKDLAAGWEEERRIPIPPGEFFKIDARTAQEWNIATLTDVNDVNDLYTRFQSQGVDANRVKVSRDDWLDHVAEFFREPLVNLLLIAVGIIGLILELKMPGVTFPGIVAAVCFILFFWAHSYVGQFTILAILLFVLGLVLVGMEIFVIPGFGITGISGILLIIASLVLVTLERMPQTSSDWVQLGTTLTTYCVALVAAFIGAFVLAWFLPSVPYANRLMLNPPDESELEVGVNGKPGGIEALSSLLGAYGEAATTLRPAGKAQIGDDYLDVVAEGDFVDAGKRVQVIEIEGNRIVVKEV